MNENDDFRISKTLSYALRHEPWRYELELDENGWADVEQVLEALRDERPQWSNITQADLERVLANATKKRHEIVGNRIRASYGHSIPGRLDRTPAAPPDILYHGTPRRALDEIEKSGLKPMSRQFVHLSPTIRVAREVGTRRDRQAVILHIDAARAHSDGIPFYAGNDVVWLADSGATDISFCRAMRNCQTPPIPFWHDLDNGRQPCGCRISRGRCDAGRSAVVAVVGHRRREFIR